MKNTRIINLEAIKDSFSLVRKQYGESEGQKTRKSTGRKKALLKQIKENLILSVSKSSDVYQYVHSEFRGGYVDDGNGYVILAHENVPSPEYALRRAELTRR